MSRPTLLIPVTFPDPELYPLTDTYVDILDGFSILLVGYWELSGQTTAAEARRAHETDAEAILYEMAAEFSHAGAKTDIQLHFGDAGSEKRALQNRIVAEADPDGVLVAKQLSPLRNILVPLRDNRHKETIVRFISAFDSEGIFVVELYHAIADEAAVESPTAMLRTVQDSLLTQGFTESDLEITVEVVEDAKEGIAAKSQDHNIVVMGETEQSNADDRLFGPIGSHLVEQTGTPVIIVR